MDNMHHKKSFRNEHTAAICINVILSANEKKEPHKTKTVYTTSPVTN